jgi:hypothetical protein
VAALTPEALHRRCPRRWDEESLPEAPPPSSSVPSGSIRTVGSEFRARRGYPGTGDTGKTGSMLPVKMARTAAHWSGLIRQGHGQPVRLFRSPRNSAVP